VARLNRGQVPPPWQTAGLAARLLLLLLLLPLPLLLAPLVLGSGKLPS
jgi:hypothetical protein